MRWRWGLLGALVIAVLAGTYCVVLYPGAPGQPPVPMVDVKPPPMPLHNTPATFPPTPSRTSTQPFETPTPSPSSPAGR